MAARRRVAPRLARRLRGAPNMKVVEGFRRDDICLTRVPTENFCGFLFVNLDPDARSMDEWFPGVREELAAHVPQIEKLKPLECLIPEAYGLCLFILPISEKQTASR